MSLKRLATLLIIPISLFVQESFSQSYSYADKECLSCHGKPEISQIMSDGKIRSLFVDPGKWNQDIHHRGNVLCVDCHSLANPYLHFREGSVNVDCAHCHPEEAEEYQKNVHLTFSSPSPGKELPLCFHCHTKHHVLPHDDPTSSVHEKNIGETCGSCHAEVMVRRISRGGSLGKISGHRKGDISERFDMIVCISCHYQDSAHGTKRVYKDFCSRCHDVRSMANFVTGPTHLDSLRASPLNYLSSALVLTLVVGVCAYLGYRSRESIAYRVKSLFEGMRVEEEAPKKDAKVQEKEEPEVKEEDIKHDQEMQEGQEEKEEVEKEKPVSEEKIPLKKETEDPGEVQEEEQKKEPVEEKNDSQIPESKEEENQAKQTEEQGQTQKRTEEQDDNGNEGERETE